MYRVTYTANNEVCTKFFSEYIKAKLYYFGLMRKDSVSIAELRRV